MAADGFSVVELERNGRGPALALHPRRPQRNRRITATRRSG